MARITGTTRGRLVLAIGLWAGLAGSGSATADFLVDASAHARSGSWWYGPTDTGSGSSWFISDRSATAAQMKWTDGANTADAVVVPVRNLSEPKFPQGIIGTPNTTKTHIFTGFTGGAGPGAVGSTATTSGSGASSVTYGVAVNDYEASWNVVATGTLGAGAGAYYDAYAAGNDPWPVFAEDFVGVATGTFDLWVPFEITGGQSLGTGQDGQVQFASGFGFDVSYTTSEESLRLLDVAVSGTTSHVAPDSPLNFSMFRISSVTAAPDTSNPLSKSQLEALLNADLLTDRTIDTPITLGLRVTGLKIPTILRDDGSVAQISAASHAFERQALVPEPATLVTGLIGLLAAGGWHHRRSRSRPVPAGS